MALDKAGIFAANTLPRVEVQVPEWGGSVWVRTLTAAELDAFEASTVTRDRNGETKPNLVNVRARSRGPGHL
jgi:hypothetical protein